MGRFKEKSFEGIKEIQENSKETTEVGSEMLEQAQEINSVLDSIEVLDEEDIQAINETGDSYQSSFDCAFEEQVEMAGEEIRKEGEQVKESVNVELDNVNTGIGKLEQVGGISEIGRESAEKGQSKLESSAGEYEGILEDVEATMDDTQQQIETLKNNLSDIFG